MRGGSRLVAVVVAALLPAAFLSGQGRAEDPDLSWPPTGIFQEGHVGVVTSRFENFMIGTGSGIGYFVDGSWRSCASWDDPACSKVAASAMGELGGIPWCSLLQ